MTKRSFRIRIIALGVFCAVEVLLSLPAPAVAPVPSEGPRLVVLGTAQDGGLPQAGCDCARCTAARRDPALRRAVASLAIWSPAADRVDLIDATPDFRDQLNRIDTLRRSAPRRVPLPENDRHPVSDIFLTHAHIGHYLGLAQLGFEALNATAIPVYSSERMAAFLRQNAPWDQLVRRANIVLHPLAPASRVQLGPELDIEPLLVPHRAEYTDTFAYLIHGPHRTVLYVPDTDAWGDWKPSLTSVLDTTHVDIAILDGTFSSGAELPDRKVVQIGHPLEVETMGLLESRVAAGKLRVYFTHFNHSNPVLGPDPQTRTTVESRGFGILEDGQEFAL